jgi:hypothetical protein
MVHLLRSIIPASVLFVLVSSLHASDLKAVENQAKMEFHGKILLMSHPYLNNRLRFNASGVLVGNSEEGTWTMNGIAHVDDVEIKPNLVRLRATREIIVLRTEDGKLGLQPILLTKHMEVELEPSRTIATLDDVKQTVAHAFHEENLGRKINEYWRGMVRITGVNPRTGQLTMEGGDDGIYGYLGGDRPVYFPNDKIAPPKAIHKEEADYTKAASVKKTQGKTFILVVVNEKGYPEIIHLLKDLGDDLDTQTLAATSQWRFRPATKDGQPVAVVTRVNWEAVTY